MRHDRRCFGRLEQEDQRLKKHYGRWMDIVRSLELESCILTKLTKPSVPVNLVGPQVSSRYTGSQLAGGVFIFLCVIRRHFLWVRANSGGKVFFREIRWPVRWVPAVRGKRFFHKILVARPVGPRCQVEE